MGREFEADKRRSVQDPMKDFFTMFQQEKKKKKGREARKRETGLQCPKKFQRNPERGHGK